MSDPATTYTVTVAPDKAGSRLDRLLADALDAVSRSRLRVLIESGAVADDQGRPVLDPALRVRAGRAFAVTLPPTPTGPEAQPIPLAIVHEDAALLVVDKPAGLVVHPGAGNPDGTLVNALLAHVPAGLSSIGAPLRPGIVHRIDKDTSGLLVVAKTDSAHLTLARQFAAHTVERAYHALVWGRPKPPRGCIDRRIGRAENRIRMAAVESGGKTALTYYETETNYGTLASMVRCRLATGRTHQVRVHMASIGNPLIGDPAYGRRRRAGGPPAGPAARLESFGRQALHAFLIGFTHPETGETMRFSSPLPGDIKALTALLESL